MNDKQLAASVVNEVKKAVVGKDEMLIKALLAILSRGHILLEDIPGVGKTTMALAISRALGLSYRRVQFTPDVMPSDLTGFSLYNKETRQMEYQPGALLCNLFLADELNRATSRTQSALLEAMEEGQVTVDGVTHAIPDPFLVIAPRTLWAPQAHSCCLTANWTVLPCACPWAIPPPKTRLSFFAESRKAKGFPKCARSWITGNWPICGILWTRCLSTRKCWPTSSG